MIGPPLPYNVHTNVHAVFHGIPAPPLDLLRFPGFPPSKDLESCRSRESLRKIHRECASPNEKRKICTYRALFSFLFFLVFEKRGSRDTGGMSGQDVTNRVCTEVSNTGFCGLIFRPLVQGTDSGEENNPATVRWIDTTRTYVDM